MPTKEPFDTNSWYADFIDKSNKLREDVGLEMPVLFSEPKEVILQGMLSCFTNISETFQDDPKAIDIYFIFSGMKRLVECTIRGDTPKILAYVHYEIWLRTVSTAVEKLREDKEVEGFAAFMMSVFVWDMEKLNTFIEQVNNANNSRERAFHE